MFLCKKCHAKSGCVSGWIESKGEGPCESCGKIELCIDCDGYRFIEKAEKYV